MRSSLLRSVVLFGALTTLPLAATTFGQPDGNGHPYVGTLLFQAGDGYYYSCSGTLLSSTVMVTAAHCTVDSYGKNVATWVTFDSRISFEKRSDYATLGDFLDDPKNGWVRADVFPHPFYRGSYPDTYDIGVSVLRKPVRRDTYGALPPQGFLESIKKASENLFTTVGYGMQGYIKPFYEDTYARYFGQVRLVELKSTFNGAEMSAKYSNNPGSTSGGSCYGDSGGPVFYGTTNMVVSIVSWGITPCIGVDYNFRTDTKVAQEFLAPFLKGR